MRYCQKKESAHLEEYNNLAAKSLSYDKEIITKMTNVQEICSAILSIRKDYNLRVRLPLQSATVFTKEKIEEEFFEIIKSETNIKNFYVKDFGFSEFAYEDVKLDMKKIGEKFNHKAREIIAAAKSNQWKINNSILEICGESLTGEFFEIIYKSKQEDFPVRSCLKNKMLIVVETKITEDLEKEGFAKDLIRKIQIKRKEADFKLDQKIQCKILCKDSKIYNYIQEYQLHIKDQTLIEQLELEVNSSIQEEYDIKL